MLLPGTCPAPRLRPTGPPRRPHSNHRTSRQNAALPVRAVIEAVRVARAVQSSLLLAEDRLRSGQILEAGRLCRAAVSAVTPIMAVEPELHATAQAVYAHVSVVAGQPAAIEAVRRYYATAVDRTLTGAGDRLIYAAGLKAVLLATTRPTLAADTLDALLQQPAAAPATAQMLTRALIAVHDASAKGPDAPASPPPLLPGGAHLAPWVPPDPDCLAWLIHAAAPTAPSTGPVSGQAARLRDPR
jgi:hypothetical protein